MDKDGHKARQHDNDLEHIGPDHSFDSTLLNDGSDGQTEGDNQANAMQ